MFTLDKNTNLVNTLHSLIGDERNCIANMANFSSFIFNSYTALNWSGFYLLDKAKPKELILGPFQGKPACIRLTIGIGVCGSSFTQNQPLNIADVDQFPGHIYCDPVTKSELVIPISINDTVIGVFDIDSTVHNRFDSDMITEVEAMVSHITKVSDWSQLHLV